MVFGLAQANSILVPAVASLAALVGSLVLLAVVVATLPSDYFTRREPPRSRFADSGRHIRLTAAALRNAAALVLLVAGVIMLVTPGQGVLTILIALVIGDFHRKREIELWLVRRAHVMAALNRVRVVLRRSPLEEPHRFMGDSASGV